MSTKMYETDRLYVRPLEVEDIESSHYQKWFYDQTVSKYNSHGLFPYTAEQKIEFIERIKSGKEIIWAVITKIEWTEPEEYEIHIGNIALQRLDWINRSAELACLFGEKEFWGKGYGTESVKLLFDHGFQKLNLNRIWTGTAATNIGMRKIAEKLGMKQEGTFREGHYLEGKYVDVVEYGILKTNYISKDEECRHPQIDKVGGEYENTSLFCTCQQCTEQRWKKQDQQENKTKIIDQISEVRAKNNKNWMDILKIANEKAPSETKQIMKNIIDCDNEVSALVKQLVE